MIAMHRAVWLAIVLPSSRERGVMSGLTIRELMVLGGMSLVFLAGCGGGKASTVSKDNPFPAIITISPASTLAGGAAFTLTVSGTNFISSSVVNFGGTAVATNFVSSTRLTAAVPAAAIAKDGTATVIVSNPAPGGGTSNVMSFAIGSGTNAVPTISSLYPNCTPAGGKAFTLFVGGSNLLASSVVRWNGSDRPTTVNGTSGLSVGAQIPASDIAAPGTAAVTVFNPATGVSSNSLTLTITPGGVFPESIAVDPTGKFAYVADEGCPDGSLGAVSMYTIDSTTGILTSIGLSVTTADFGAGAVVVDPLGRFAYVANASDLDINNGSVSMYTINSTTGILTSTGTISPPNSGLFDPSSVAIDPSGKFAYVAYESGLTPTISVYTINPTNGTLTSSGTVPAAGRAGTITVHPSGKFAYVTDFSSENSSEVSMYAINTTTGALFSFLGTVAAGLSATSLAIDPTGKFAYLANGGSNDISMYTIDTTTGLLTSTGPIAAGMGPRSVAVHPTGNFAYVVNHGSNDVSMYAINATTGVLTTIGTIAAGSSPSSIAINPSGKFAYVTNYGSNNVSMYSIDVTTGALTLIGTIGT